MKELIIGLDGVTFQPVGELLLESGTTFEQRRECKATYRECLRYVSLAVLLSDRIGIPKEMPLVGGDQPGQSLANLLGQSFVLPVGGYCPHNWDELLMKVPAFEERVANWLKLLDDALSIGRRFWEDLVIREVRADYLGKHELHTSRQVEPSGLKLKAPHYVGHLSIQKAIPNSFVIQLRKRIKAKFGRLNVPDGNIDEFISRMAVTHVVNYWRMNLDIEAAYEGGFLRLPHMTRSAIQFVELRRSEPSDQKNVQDQKRDQVIRAVLPYPLRHLLRGLKRREDLIQRLMELRDLGPFPKLRDKVKKAFGELQQGKHNSATKLCKEIETLSNSAEDSAAEPASVIFGIRWEGGGGLTADVQVPIDLLKKWTSPHRYCLRELTSVSEGSEQRDLNRVFEELV